MEEAQTEVRAFAALDRSWNGKKQDMELHSCLIHNCQPVTIGKGLEYPGLDEDSKLRWKISPDAVLRKMFPSVMFFLKLEHVAFCPECAAKNPMPGKHNKFGWGLHISIQHLCMQKQLEQSMPAVRQAANQCSLGKQRGCKHDGMSKVQPAAIYACM